MAIENLSIEGLEIVGSFIGIYFAVAVGIAWKLTHKYYWQFGFVGYLVTAICFAATNYPFSAVLVFTALASAYCISQYIYADKADNTKTP